MIFLLVLFCLIEPSPFDFGSLSPITSEPRLAIQSCWCGKYGLDHHRHHRRLLKNHSRQLETKRKEKKLRFLSGSFHHSSNTYTSKVIAFGDYIRFKCWNVLLMWAIGPFLIYFEENHASFEDSRLLLLILINQDCFLWHMIFLPFLLLLTKKGAF